MVKRKEAFPRKHFSADDVADGPVTLTIERTQQETMRGNGKEETKTVLYFRGGYKPLPLNRVNWDSVARITGEDDSDNWPGHQIEAYRDTTQTPGGEIVPCVRLREPPQGELKPQPQPAAKPTLPKATAAVKPTKPQLKPLDGGRGDLDDPLHDVFN
jgi:hypothetical protein